MVLELRRASLWNRHLAGCHGLLPTPALTEERRLTCVLAESFRYADLGLRQIPCIGKRPAIPNWPQAATTDKEKLREWFSDGTKNIGLLTGRQNGIIVLDLDSNSAGEALFRKHPELCKVIVETRKGIHVYFRHPGPDVPNAVRITLDGIEADIRGERGQVLCPPDRNGAHTYVFAEGHELRDLAQLPVLPERWIPRKHAQRVSGRIGGEMDKILRAQKYIDQIESIEFQGGDRACFRVCCVLRDFGLSVTEAWPLLVLWNQARAKPPWPEVKLRHDLAGAYALPTKRKITHATR